jgi:hypothetical protein
MTNNLVYASRRYTAALPVEDVEHRIARDLAVDADQVRVVGVWAYTKPVENGVGMIVDYVTEWEFEAEVSL